MSNNDFTNIYNQLIEVWSSHFENDLSDNFDIPELDNILDYELYDPWNYTEINEFDESPYKRVLSSKGEKKLEYIKYDQIKERQTSCSISLEQFISGEYVIKLPCSHIFKKEEILKWLKNEKAKCPLCRYELPSKEIKIEKPNQPIEVIDTFYFNEPLQNTNDFFDCIISKTRFLKRAFATEHS